ncbi:hypothetical protein HDV00_005553 [Rhizophlyctis rosea]|nr:hypothetical protein HDV00_005553 [Rhizophlyctis rosea]
MLSQQGCQQPNILHLIFAYFLHPFHLVTASKVCRTWRKVAETNVAWKRFANSMQPIDGMEIDFAAEDDFDEEQGAIKTNAEARQFCMKYFQYCCGVCLNGLDDYTRTYHGAMFGDDDDDNHDNSYVEEDLHSHKYEGGAKRLMKHYGFEKQGWKYFANKGWDEGLKVEYAEDDGEGLGWGEWEKGYDEEDACSDILCISSAESWIKEKALKLGYYQGITGGHCHKRTRQI